MTVTVGSLVAARPALGSVFESLGIDYCCGGHKTLDEAALEKGLDPRTLERTLAAFPPAEKVRTTEAANPADLPTPELLDYIISTHHSFVRQELPRLVALAARVAQAHGPSHAELFDLDQGVQRLSHALLDHLAKEEEILFPAIRASGPGPHPRLAETLAPFFGEHEEAGGLLAGFRGLTDGFAHPEWACNTYRALMDGLNSFENDLHRHVHLENNVLFLRIAG